MLLVMTLVLMDTFLHELQYLVIKWRDLTPCDDILFFCLLLSHIFSGTFLGNIQVTSKEVQSKGLYICCCVFLFLFCKTTFFRKVSFTSSWLLIPAGHYLFKIFLPHLIGFHRNMPVVFSLLKIVKSEVYQGNPEAFILLHCLSVSSLILHHLPLTHATKTPELCLTSARLSEQLLDLVK